MVWLSVPTQRIGIGNQGTGARILIDPDGLRQIFEIDLMADAGAGRHDAEIIECLLAPAQEGITLAVAFEFALDVFLE